MQASAFSRLLTAFIPVLFLASCGQGDGPEPIRNTPATPLPPLPEGFCDAINFEILCDPVGIVPFGGGETFIRDNKYQEGINLSDRVAMMKKFADAPFGGTRLDLDGPLDFADGEAFTMKVWSRRAVPVLFKLEQQNRETTVRHGGGAVWEELCFDFSGATDATPNNGLTIIFDDGRIGQADGDLNNDDDGWTFYYDDILQVESCPTGGLPAVFSTITFDDPSLNYSLAGFGGAEDSSIVNDPAGGTNQVVQVNRSATAETFAGTTVSLGPNQAVPDIPLDASTTQMTVRVFSPAAGIPVRLKIENASNSAIAVETETITTVGNDWETLTFDFSMQAPGTPAFDPAATYNKIIIFFNFGTTGAAAGAQTFYFDDIDVGSGGGMPPGPTPFGAVTFDDPAITYALRGFEGAEDSTVVTDPVGGPNQVVQVNRSATAATFAGTVVSTLANEAVGVIPLDAANTGMTMRVYSPAAGIPVRLKIENSLDPAIFVETEAITTVGNDWETLTFDFSMQAMGTQAFDPAATYDKIIIFFNFGTDGATAGAQTFYFDDIDVVAGGGGPGPGPADHGPGTASVFTETTTESAITVTGYTNSADFGGNSTTADPMSMAIPAFEGNVVLSIDYQNTGGTFGGALLNFGGADLTAYDALNFTIDTSGIAGFADLTLQIEEPSGPVMGNNVNLSAYVPVATSGTWATYQIPLADFPASNLAAASNLGFWNAREAGGGLVYGTLYLDDIYLSTEGGGGPGPGGNLATNGDLETGDETGWTNFDNDGTVAVSTDNPSSGTYSLNINVVYAGGGAPTPAAPTAKFERIAVGTVQANQALTVSFDIRGTITQPGAGFNIQFFTETAGGGPSKEEFLGGGPVTASIPNWETRTYNITTGPDASGGITLQFNAACGPVDGCAQDMYIDNVSITID